jgi:hypothetical protein
MLRCALAEAPSGGVWLVRVTRGAAADLALSAGATVWLAVKSHSVRLLRR